MRPTFRRNVFRDVPASFVRFLPLVILFLAVFFAASAALHHPRPALAKPEPGGEAPASPPPLILRPPTDFVEIKEKNGTLFAENARQLGERARLLRLFLPENQAHFYEEGKHYALTRQLAVYGIAKANDAPFNKDDIALLGRILEEGFLSFDKAPSAALRDSLALEEVLLQAGRDGRNLLLDTRSTENLRLFQYQLAYPLSPGHAGSPADDRMLSILTTLILLVRGHIVFFCASSINTQDPLYDDAVWTRDVVEKYMETLLADNKKN